MNKLFKYSEKGLIPIFVYGTLMHPRTRAFVLKHKEDAERVLLPKYKREKFTTPEGTEFPTIVKSEFSKISGDLLLVTKSDFELLNKWEDQYFLSPVKLSNGITAYTFILKKRDELKKE